MTYLDVAEAARTVVDGSEDIIDETDIPAPLDEIDQEKRLIRKLDRRILPLTCLLYLFAYLDRSNLGNARLQGLPEDVLNGDPTGELFSWVYSSFYITYIIFQVPGSILSKYNDPRIWIGCSAIAWGICSTIMATGRSFADLLIARLGLGLFEAGFGPTIVIYYSYYYTKNEFATRFAYWLGFAAVAGAFGGLLAFGIQHSRSSIAQWRLLFLVEGTPAILLGIVCLFILPSRPESATFLSPLERKLALERMSRGTSGDTGHTVNRSHIIAAFLDWRVYIAGVIYFGLNCALASISAFLPTIIKTLGHTNATAQLLTVPPYAAAGTFLVLLSYLSDRMQTRGLLTAASCFLGAFGYILLLTIPHNQQLRYFATFCITSGTYASIGLVNAWFVHNLGSETKRATGVPIFGAIGQCGSILGSHIYPLTEGPHYVKGFSVSCGLELLAALCAILLTLSFRWDNRRRDELYGKPEPDAKVDTSDLADKAPAFRYIP